VAGILADNDSIGQVRRLVALLESDEWHELWEALNLSVLTIAELGLAPNTPDAQVWRICQEKGLVLITSNRNSDSADSLELTIRAENQSDSLPVFTLADPGKVRNNKNYADDVAATLLEYLHDIDKLRGTGRLYLP
jgi:hypothetical protein